MDSMMCRHVSIQISETCRRGSLCHPHSLSHNLTNTQHNITSLISMQYSNNRNRMNLTGATKPISADVDNNLRSNPTETPSRGYLKQDSSSSSQSDVSIARKLRRIKRRLLLEHVSPSNTGHNSFISGNNVITCFWWFAKQKNDSLSNITKNESNSPERERTLEKQSEFMKWSGFGMPCFYSLMKNVENEWLNSFTMLSQIYFLFRKRHLFNQLVQ